MELLVATWTVRLTLLAAALTGWVSWNAGGTLSDVVLRAVVAAFVVTFAGRQLMGYLETPLQRRQRLLLAEAKRSGKQGKGKAAEAADVAGDADAPTGRTKGR